MKRHFRKVLHIFKASLLDVFKRLIMITVIPAHLDRHDLVLHKVS